MASGHSQFELLRQRRFAPFFATQLLGAFNDNVFRNATIVLITAQLGLSTDQASLYTNLAPALFILPFFLFSALAGQFVHPCGNAHRRTPNEQRIRSGASPGRASRPRPGTG